MIKHISKSQPEQYLEKSYNYYSNAFTVTPGQQAVPFS
jgi:hypothetical protein